jgi:hypothetical protein
MQRHLFHDTVADSVELLLAEGILPGDIPPAYQERATPEKVNYRETDWHALFRRLEDGLGDIENDLSRDGQLFRRRFRLPFSEFHRIYVEVLNEEWFGQEKLSKRIAPLFMKIMGVFRLLGRNLVYDDITEISKIKEEAMRVFFRDFVSEFARRHFNHWMRQPQTTADIYENERVYRSNGSVFQFLQVSVTELIVLSGCQAAATRSMDFTCAGNAVQLLGIQSIMVKRAALQLCIKL